MDLKLMKAGVACAVASLMTMALSSASFAQDTTIKTKKQAELMIPRPAMQPMESMIEPEEAMDTIETANPHIKIVLYSDYSWKYVKEPGYANEKEAFNEYWDTESVVPFRGSLDELPDKFALWIVDSLSTGYHCPKVVKPYSKFGYRHRRRHQGVDLPLQVGTPVYAAFDGKVRFSKYYKGYGNLVIIRHENGLETFYAHLSKRLAQVGDWVNAGAIIGLGGSTGRSNGPHLHFETRYKGNAFDPEWLIDFETGTLRHRLFMMNRNWFNANSKYVPENDDEEIDIIEGDIQDRIKAEEEAKAAAEAARKAELEKRYYTIKSGDTLGAIARRNHTTVKKLCNLNGISEKTVLQIGRKIRVK